MLHRLCFCASLVVLVMGCGGNGSGAASTPPQAPDNEKGKPSSSEVESGQGQTEPEEEPPPLGGGGAAMPNPAAVHCIEKGGKLEAIDTGSAQYGVCVFNDGSRCNQWSFVRGECSPGQCFDQMGKCEKEEKSRETKI